MQNPFLEGSVYDQRIFINEFSERFYMRNPEDQTKALSMLPMLEDALFDSCVATQVSIIKAITLLRIYDNYPATRVQQFIERAQNAGLSLFVQRKLAQLAQVNTMQF